MSGREGQKRLERPATRRHGDGERCDRGKIEIGVGEPRTELDRAPRHGLGAVVFALVVQKVGEVAVGLGVVGFEGERGAPALLRLGRAAEPLEGVAEVVERLRDCRLEGERAFEAERLSSSFSASCRTMPRLFQAPASVRVSAIARRAACSPSASSPF